MEIKHFFKNSRNNEALAMCSFKVTDSRLLQSSPTMIHQIAMDRGLALGVEESTCILCLKKFLTYSNINREKVINRIKLLEKIARLT